ncbi:MAG: NACHT domain-containing protein [Desmonostoc geniculatum HA4340-LM1]|jgi:predicted NACHT family NTPase|nr:NACHT domain-containing protein [Desmonostoc geniculatum HA4340-LM1]
MSESLITQIITSIIVDFSKDIVKLIIKFIPPMDHWSKMIPDQNKYDRYHKNYEKRHGIVKVLGMRKFKKLQSIYTEVQFLDDNAIRILESAKIPRFPYKDTGRQEGITLAKDKQYLMVLGEPGAGKSTFLKIIGLEALKGQEGEFKHASIPVFIELKKLAFSNINIDKLIVQELDNLGFPSADKFTPKALEEGRLLILLDALDEVPIKNLTETITQIQDFVYKYDKNRFIISCREAAYRYNLDPFTDVTIADFDDIQIQYVINNWFQTEPNTGKNFWQKLNSAEYTVAKELTRTPLLLTLLCLLYENGKFSNNRATLYEKVLNVLLHEWADENNISREQHPLDIRRKKEILSEIAYDAFQKNHLFLQRQEIADKIDRILSQIVPNDTSIRGEDVLRTIEVEHGVLVKRTDGINFFSYPSLQNYLTAQYINNRHQVDRLVIQHLTDERWKEVFLMVAALMHDGADKLLLLMEKRAKQYITAIFR